MPNRIVREGILTSERINALSPNAELFYRRLMSVVDDFGRFSAHHTLLRAACYPLKLDSVKEDSIKKHLAECVDAGLIVLFTVAAKTFLELQDFRQQVRAKESKYPAPDKQGIVSCVADATHVIRECSADAQLMQSNAHLDVDVDVDEEEQQGASPDGAALIESPQAQRLKTDPIPYQAIADAYNRELTRLPKVQTLTPKRKTLMRTAWQADPRFRSVGFWADYFAACEADPFRNGTGPYTNGHANWRPTLDYLLRADVVVALVERVATPGVVP